MKKVLVIAAHPDDEILGCGGTIFNHTNVGDEVFVLIMSQGIDSRDKVKNSLEKKNKLNKAAIKANKNLGVKKIFFEKLPDNSMDKFNRLKVIKIIERYIHKIKPKIVYTHHVGDVNVDHQVLHHSVVTACRPIPNHPVKELYFFEVSSSTEWQTPSSGNFFQPNAFFDITNSISCKLKSLEIYEMEMKEWPHPRSIDAVHNLSKYRGSSIGVNNAEAFIIGRLIK